MLSKIVHSRDEKESASNPVDGQEQHKEELEDLQGNNQNCKASSCKAGP